MIIINLRPYLGTHRTLSGTPWMFLLLLSNAEHWASRKPLDPSGQSLVPQDLYLTLTPMQYLPPCFGVGLSQSRYDFLTPPPHVREQGPNLKDANSNIWHVIRYFAFTSRLSLTPAKSPILRPLSAVPSCLSSRTCPSGTTRCPHRVFHRSKACASFDTLLSLPCCTRESCTLAATTLSLSFYKVLFLPFKTISLLHCLPKRFILQICENTII